MSMTGVIPVAARRWYAELLSDASNDHPIYIAWGRGTTALTIYDTRLVEEIQRIQATVSFESPDIYLLQASFTFTALTAGNASEAGCFDAAAGGRMFWRGGFHNGDPTGLYTCTSRAYTAGQVMVLYVRLQVYPS